MLKDFTDKELKEMSLEEAKNIISNNVYEATYIIEALEFKGKINGHGHTIRQKMAKFAEDMMKERWIDSK